MPESARYKNTAEAAAYMGSATSTLNKLRCIGGGPVFARLGKRRVVYDVRDLDAWLEGNKRTSTSDSGLNQQMKPFGSPG